MFEIGDKVKLLENRGNMIWNFQKGKVGEIVEIYFKNLEVAFEDGILISSKEYFEKVEEFEVGEEVIYHHPVVGEIKAEIFGISDKKDVFGEDYAISYKIYGDINIAVTEKNKLSKIKSKDELEKGDKVKTFAEIEKEIISKHYNEDQERYEFFVKHKGFNNIEMTEIILEEDIKKVIV